MFQSTVVIFLMKLTILTERRPLQVGSEFFLTTLLSNMITVSGLLVYFLTQNYKQPFLKGALVLLRDKSYLETKLKVSGSS